MMKLQPLFVTPGPTRAADYVLSSDQRWRDKTTTIQPAGTYDFKGIPDYYTKVQNAIWIDTDFSLMSPRAWYNREFTKRLICHRPTGRSPETSNPTNPMKKLIVSAVLLAPVWCSSVANAGAVALQLVRTSLNNVDDAAGRFQHEGGNIVKSKVTIGQYLIIRRVTTPATSTMNVAATTITLFLGTGSTTAPNNITLQGAHNFSAGNFRGSVSAASNRYSFLQGADATYTAATGTETLVMSWTGSSQLTVP